MATVAELVRGGNDLRAKFIDWTSTYHDNNKEFLRGDMSPPEVEAQIARNIVPIRPDRQRTRSPSCSLVSFNYRIS